MVTFENHLGTVEVAQEYFSNLIGNAVSSCYGVAGMMKAGPRQSIRSLLTRRSFMDDGIRVRSIRNKLVVDLHIEVVYGMNISAISNSIVNKVRYTVEKATGLEVLRVNVFVDGMKGE